MKAAKKAKAEANGWRLGTADEFLDLGPEESALIDLKLALSDALRARRIASRVTQGELARRLGSSQSRVRRCASMGFVRAHGVWRSGPADQSSTVRPGTRSM